ncbi:hypothetical protein OHA72_55435 [Dactylosporangium sp. NBC_01737]|uniref:hypothetical protein n=1 Tax=Dactylosporangium sp. NBC_01737 TaxID=2975959 RepID=UPI002E139C68|nr:hypothetical protein OHA72_55435 [Dactylosporangium sp. NBC_01737]
MAGTPEVLWEQVAAGTDRLGAHLREHPDDRAVLAAAPHPGGATPWIGALVGNGVRLGLIDPTPDVGLLTSATAAVIGAVDAWALRRTGAQHDALTVLVRRLWNTRGE